MTGGGDSAPDISVVIPHHDDCERLVRCVDQLERQTLPRHRFEIVVADNRSACGLQAVADMLGGRARVVDAPVAGAGPARNAGVAAARGAILAFTDADCHPAEDWLARGIAALRKGDVVGGSVVVTIGDDSGPTPAEAYEMVFAFQIERYFRRRGFVSSCNLFVRRDVFETVGGFQQTVSEDVDWCWRARAKGFTLRYEPAAVIRHPARRTWAELVRKTDRVTREMFHLAMSRRSNLWSVRCHALLVLASPLGHAWRILARRDMARHTRVEAVAVLVLLRMRRARLMLALAAQWRGAT